VRAALAALRDGADPADLAAAGEAVDEALGRAERSGRFDSRHEALLTLTRGAIRLALEASSPGGADPHTGWWFVAGVKCVGDVVDDAFTAEAWPVLARLE
jgi:hypothetical protein